MNRKSDARALCVSMLLVMLCFLPGCGGNGDDGDGGSDDGDGGASQGPVVRDANPDLLGDYLPPIDGLIEIAPPKEWTIRPRQSPYLVQFSGSAARINPLPRIRITTELSDFEASTVDKDNLSSFKAHIESQLKEAGREKYVREPPVAMIIGGRPCVRFVSVGRVTITSTKNLSIETQRLVTVVGGRQYDFDLQVVEGQIPEYRDQSYAVFGNIKFLKEDSEPAPSPEKEEGASEDDASEDDASEDDASDEGASDEGASEDSDESKQE